MAPRQLLLRCSTFCIPAVEGGESRQEVERLEQELSGAVAKGMFQLVHHQAVAVAAQTFERNGGPRDVATQPLELSSLGGPAGHRSVQREAVPRRGERLVRLHRGGVVEPGTCRRSVLRPAIGPTAMRPRTEALSSAARASSR